MELSVRWAGLDSFLRISLSNYSWVSWEEWVQESQEGKMGREMELQATELLVGLRWRRGHFAGQVNVGVGRLVVLWLIGDRTMDTGR